MAPRPRKDTDEIAKIARDAAAPREGILMSGKALVTAVFLLGAAGTGGSMLGVNFVAPDPKAVVKTQEDVSEIKTELAKLNVTLQSFAEATSRDKVEFERRYADVQRQLDKLQTLADDAREIKDLKRRVEALEKK